MYPDLDGAAGSVTVKPSGSTRVKSTVSPSGEMLTEQLRRPALAPTPLMTTPSASPAYSSASSAVSKYAKHPSPRLTSKFSVSAAYCAT